jgi:PAS domain S-box-containing protein
MSEDVSFNVSASEKRLMDVATLVEASDIAIIGKSLGSIILSWNRGAERMYGYSAEEAIGNSISLLILPDRLHEAEEIIQRIEQGELVEHFETVRRAKDGRLLEVSLIVTPTRDATGAITGALLISRDITEQKQAQRELQKLQAATENRALVLETANRVALDILASRTGVEALRHIAEAARTLSHARYAALGVARPNGQGLMEFITTGLTPAEEATIGARPTGGGILGLLLKRTEPLRVDSLGLHPASVGFPPNHPPMQSFLGVPIRRGATVSGSLYLTDKEGGGPFTEADEAAVQALSAYAAVAIYNLHLVSRQRALVSGLISVQEEERRAVAYDLHDGLTQYVMASHAHLESFRRAHASENRERAERELEQGLRYLKEAVLESRRLVNGLRTLALDDLGLAGAMEQLVAEEKARAGWLEAECVYNIAGKRYHKSLETAVYRVAQEALNNARKHARTDRVRIALLESRDASTNTPQLVLEVRDWGQGFIPEETMNDYAHVGLHSMVERVGLMGGAYTLQSAPGEGTTIQAVFLSIEPQAEETEGESA